MQDVPEAVRCCNEEQIRRFIPPLPIPYTEDDAIAFIGAAQQRLDQGSVTLVIGEGGDAALRGSIGLRTIAPGIAQTGYWVAPEARGRGLAGTALVLLSRWALADAAADPAAAVRRRRQPGLDAGGRAGRIRIRGHAAQLV